MSTTGVVLHQSGSYLNKPDEPSLIISGSTGTSPLGVIDLTSEDRQTRYDNVSFRRLPYHIWKKIFRYSGVICPCHIAFLPVRHGGSQTYISILGHRQRYHGDRGRTPITQPGLVTCAVRKIPEFDDGLACQHEASNSMLGVSRIARFMTMKAILEEGSFHFELRDTTDVDGLERTLRGFEDMQPLNRELKRLHVNFFFSKCKASDSLDVWYYFCDYFGKHLKGTLTHFGLECRPVTIENARGITASKAISNLRGLQRCNVLFDSLARGRNERLWSQYVDLSEVFVRDVVCIWKHKGPFRFMDLPIEIQILILQYALTTNKQLYRGARSWAMWRVKGDTNHSPLGQGPKHYCCMCSTLKCPKALSSNTTCNCLRTRSEALKFMLRPKEPEMIWEYVSPVSIFLTNKHIHTLGASVFYSQNKFTFWPNEIIILWKPDRPFVSFGFPRRHIGRIRHLVISCNSWTFRTKQQVERYRRLAKHLRNTFRHISLDLVLSDSQKDYDTTIFEKVFSFFDDFEGERPESYRRKT